MDTTRREMALWIERIDRSRRLRSIVDGVGLEWESGFVDEGDGYEGDALFISSSEVFRAIVRIGVIHVQRLGFRWSLATERIPLAPFLITSDLSLSLTFEGFVEIEPSDDAIEVFGRNGPNGAYPIAGLGWFGILGYGHSENICSVRCFSSEASRVREDEDLMFTEWDCSVGRVLSVGCSPLNLTRS